MEMPLCSTEKLLQLHSTPLEAVPMPWEWSLYPDQPGMAGLQLIGTCTVL